MTNNIVFAESVLSRSFPEFQVVLFLRQLFVAELFVPDGVFDGGGGKWKGGGRGRGGGGGCRVGGGEWGEGEGWLDISRPLYIAMKTGVDTGVNRSYMLHALEGWSRPPH